MQVLLYSPAEETLRRGSETGWEQQDKERGSKKKKRREKKRAKAEQRQKEHSVIERDTQVHNRKIKSAN